MWKQSFKVAVQGEKKNIVLPQRWADSTVQSPFEEVGLICHWAMGEAAMQKHPDYKEIISSNPPVVLHRLVAILHCLSYLFSACISSPVRFITPPSQYIYFRSPLYKGRKACPPRPAHKPQPCVFCHAGIHSSQLVV